MSNIDRLDYFAGLAMQAFIVRMEDLCEDDDYAIWAYRVAQEMLVERSRIDAERATKGSL